MQPKENPDETGLLLSKVATGDRDAFAALWEVFSDRLVVLGLRYLGSYEDGQDLAQETFLRIYRAAGKFDPAKGNGKTWIYTIARNIARDRLRRQRLRWIVGLDDLPTAIEDSMAGPERVTLDRDALSNSHAATLNLPDAQRMALLLSVVGDVQTSEIADIMGKSRGSVEQLIVRARRYLRAATKEDDDVAE